jgi:hypothetical protein
MTQSNSSYGRLHFSDEIPEAKFPVAGYAIIIAIILM